MRIRNDTGGRGGYTLVEVAIVVAIVAILATLAVSSFRGLNDKYKVEEQTKQLYADLMDVRGRAMQRSRFCFAVIGANRYTTYMDGNPAPDGNGSLETALDNLVADVAVNYPIVTNLPGTVSFNRSGIASDNGILRFSSNARPDYDCITVLPTRIKMGQWNGASCVEK